VASVATTALLVRHGVTDWNATRRAQGHADVELNEAGRRQADEAAERLAGTRLGAVYSSDLRRALDTARPVADRHGLEVVVDSAWREIDQGEWEGLSGDEIAARWPELWGPARHFARRPGGEAPEEVAARALAGLRRIVDRHPGDSVAVITHGGTIRWVVATARGYGVRGSARIRGLANGGIVAVETSLADGELIFGAVRRLDGAEPDLDDPNA
jgi:2,3-bisphosphoglycerate-dependent phosphoglycerate mutase